MVQESYADFSIIQKYLDQKKYHEETLKGYEAKIAEGEKGIAALREEINAKDQIIRQLQNQVEETQLLVKKREKSIQDLNIQLHRMKQLHGNPQPRQGAQLVEDEGSRKAKFSFLK